MKVVLFALTGFGNSTLKALLDKKCTVCGVFTRKEKGPFPYYEEENICLYGKRNNVVVYDEFDWNFVKKVIEYEQPKLLLVSTFHKIIPKKIFCDVLYSINLHPALLPRYRGPTPIPWVLYNREKETGMTAHLLTEIIDAGDILLQNKVVISEMDNEKSLRLRLVSECYAVTSMLVDKLYSNDLHSEKQNENLATYFKKFKYENRIL